jgi:hypothetical protein
MALDNQGKQPRTLFYTDSIAIQCIAMAAAANPDATLDFVIRQTTTQSWTTTPTVTNLPDDDVFSAGELTIGAGATSETAEAYNIPAAGIVEAVQCDGLCYQNPFTPGSNPCAVGFTNEGPDSAGPGETCCYQFGQMPCSSMSTSIPFPVGHFECDVSLNGEPVGSAPFDIVYPPDNAQGESCPTIPAITGSSCYNWVPPGSICQGAQDFCCECVGPAPSKNEDKDPQQGNWYCATPSNAPCDCGPGCVRNYVYQKNP